MIAVRATTRLSIFPLPGALLFPRMHLPLHIFEPRYRAMIPTRWRATGGSA